MNEHDARINLRTRQLSRSLVESDGWQSWALPELRRMLDEKQRAILDDTNLRGTALDDARAEHRALTNFLKKLHEQAQAAFQSILPGTLPEETAEQVMPSPDVRQKVLDLLSHTPGKPFSASPIPHPESRIPNPATHNPFAGLPQPVASR